MSEPDLAKIRLRIAQIASVVVFVSVVIVTVVLYAGREADASAEQMAAIRKYVQVEQLAKGYESIKGLDGEDKKKAMMAQTVWMKQLENLPIESAKVRGWGPERIVHARLRYSTQGPVQERFFTMNILTGKWTVVGDAMSSRFQRKVW